MSFSETIFLFFLALIIFGPKKLPEIARQVGKFMNEFRRASNEFKSQIEQEIAHLEVENKPTILPPAQPVEGTTSRSANVVDAETPRLEAPATTAGSNGSSSGAESAQSSHDAAATLHSSETASSESASSETAETPAVTSSSSQESHA